MAKRKKRKIRYRMRPKRKYRRKAKRAYTGAVSDLGKVAYGAFVGAGRQYVLSPISSYVSKLPFGKYNDNVVMGALAMTAKRFMKNKHIKNIADATLYVEGALMGNEAVSAIGVTQPSSSNLW